MKLFYMYSADKDRLALPYTNYARINIVKNHMLKTEKGYWCIMVVAVIELDVLNQINPFPHLGDLR